MTTQRGIVIMGNSLTATTKPGGDLEAYKVSRVSEILGCSNDTTRQLIKNGELEAVRVGKRRISVTRASIAAYIQRNKVKPIAGTYRRM